ncbi:hypothetical protein [Lactiplantibacillus paraplantarum]|uniref:Uncharacterized protein n=1 Tax=Lactiplantibacillus paraplantarum TaxID=60520 RepID=A0AAD0TWW7_9LACO|nr:hypothetical protein [Lactiplantibacillus paraplantarum]AYJ38896.1 hypothetical protein LP667_08735 [Lactiplantibacillus paraplantarum]AYJ38950.1 hypothetical protein LP667_09030 [Lactiplantibacillus paraplantarum]MCU4683991.1 hypothetical protein [Lactiplantibacillus paraplantarum]MDL2061074.1 hypothetical protein [Lactiplantibacillus paraplantarum]RKD24903.1 hypothetical protein BG617_13610 [Lactiplantibacillus paraplantarum]
MKRFNHQILLAAVQVVEQQYGSVTDAPPDALKQVHAISACMPDALPTLTHYELLVMKRVIANEISLTKCSQMIGHSNTWLKPRLLAVIDGNYFLSEENYDETTETHQEING